MLRNILMNRIVRETRQRIGHFIDVNFGFLHANRFRQPQNSLDDLLKFALGQQFDRAGLSSRRFAAARMLF